MVTAGLQAVRLLLIHMVDMHVMAVVLSQERIVQKLTVKQHMPHVMLQKILLQQVLQISVKYSFHMLLVLHSLHL